MQSAEFLLVCSGASLLANGDLSNLARTLKASASSLCPVIPLFALCNVSDVLHCLPLFVCRAHFLHLLPAQVSLVLGPVRLDSGTSAQRPATLPSETHALRSMSSASSSGLSYATTSFDPASSGQASSTFFCATGVRASGGRVYCMFFERLKLTIERLISSS